MAETSCPLWTLGEIARAVGSSWAGADRLITGITYDSRDIAPGDLFVALKGQRDGHDFLASARASGAAGALVERSDGSDGDLIVDDTLSALERLGLAGRERAEARRGAVTGSVGKTSVTQAILAGLTLAGPAHGSIKSYNNHIGVPLTLARMPRETKRAVFEIGMNAPGEIGPLARQVRPHAACVTTVGPVHIEAFADGVAGVADEKAAIFDGLAPGGTAVINADDGWTERLSDRAARAGARIRTFGRDDRSEARLIDFEPDDDGAWVTARIEGAPFRYRLAQSGQHWGLNSLAVLLMLDALGVDRDIAAAALADFRPLAGRGQVREVALPGGRFTLIDESYNANPLSMVAGFRSLAARSVAPGGHRVVVLTDMLELGEVSRELHLGLAGAIEQAGLDMVHVAGPEMRVLWEALPESRRGLWRPTAAELAAQAPMLAGPGDVVMVKGSNGSRASLVAKALRSLDVEEA